MENNKFKDEIDILIRARYPIIYIDSQEEQRTIEQIRAIAKEHNKHFKIWSITKGLTEPEAAQQITGTQEPTEALNQITEAGKQDGAGTIAVFLDIHRVIDDTMTCRKLRDIADEIKTSNSTIILISPIVKIPQELTKQIVLISQPYPEKEEISAVMDKVINGALKNAPEKIKARIEKDIEALNNGEKDAVIESLKGLTTDEAENVIAKSLMSKCGIKKDIFISEKEQIIKKTGILEYYPATTKLNDVGGMDNVKNWIIKRREAFTEKARLYGLRKPRRVFYTGLSGTGKSLLSKATASFLEIPLIRLDASKIFNSLVGESEQKIAQALKIADSISPCVLWIDEVEKLLSGAGKGANDGGVSDKVFGIILTWMQEHESPVFVVVTSNDPLSIPPEFMRRFDEVFFMDTPDQGGREEIFSIHILKVKRDPAAFKIKDFAKETEGYTGAEIEKIVMDALYNAFFEGVEVDNKHIKESIKKMIPLSEKHKENFDKLKLWGQNNCLSASGSKKKEETKARNLEFKGESK